jgi:glutathionylspermidine synthase
MKRNSINPRPDWQKRVEEYGMTYHTPNGQTYWNESAYYSFTMGEIEMLERVVAELQARCLDAAAHVIEEKRFHEFGLSKAVGERITASWFEEPPAIYGRFDLAYDGVNPPKLLEYNADTPTSLLEAAVIQWFWFQERFPKSGRDQWNSIHERLVAKWRSLKGWMDATVYFAHVADPTGEDLMTSTYLRDTASEAGLATVGITMPEIGWDLDRLGFVAPNGSPIKSVFKLYPWEWMVDEEFGSQLLDNLGRPDVADRTQWIEPIWKMLWSNKALLPILWELFPDHPNLMAASFIEGVVAEPYVKKPKLGREGANITVVGPGRSVMEQTGGDYGADGYVYQSMANRENLGNRYAVLGAWVIDGEAAGMGIRESESLVTGNLSQFVPHLIEG